MNLMPLDKLGAREIAPGLVQFGAYFPWVSAQEGNRIFVKIIHEKDQFLQQIKPLTFEMAHVLDPVYGDYWSCQKNIAQVLGPAGSAWGQPGTYVYRYEVHNPNVGILDWIVDPYAREFGVGKLSAFTLGYQDHTWSQAETNWKTPEVNDLVVYELQLEEFAGGIDGTIDKLDYLADLGINCLEIMPVSNVEQTINWGYLPTGYFGVDERFGNRSDFQRLVDEAHQRGIAVIIDAVYGHTSDSFTCSDLYRRLQYGMNPFLGSFEKDYFGESTDWSRQITQDFFYSVNQFWLDHFHIDGFRYDCVPNYWDGPKGKGFANLAYNTYQLTKTCIANGDLYWQRFANGNRVNLIQCAEQLEDPTGVLFQSFSNCSWQNSSMDSAKAVARGHWASITGLGRCWGLEGYPTEVTQADETLVKSAFQYIEDHDNERFICSFGIKPAGDLLLQEGDRENWYKVQPYLIGFLTAKGIPMLWEGQELAEDYWLPSVDIGRATLLRPVRWNYFYDEPGKRTIDLVRKVLKLRRNCPEFRRGQHYFYDHWDRYQSRGILLFSRYTEDRFSLVALNFGGSDQVVPFWFPMDGNYGEMLHGQQEDYLAAINANTEVELRIPSNYGRIWSRME